MTYDIEYIAIGTCGRCGCDIPKSHVWCDNCEDRVERVGYTRLWKEKEDAKIKE